jgi:HNH endonuclease
MRKTATAEYFWSKVDFPEDILQCWQWAGSKRTKGYGAFRNTNASRHAYMLAFGQLPNGRVFVCHRCDNPWCVNPGHLFRGSQTDNMQDASQKGRLIHSPAPYIGNKFAAKLSGQQINLIRSEYRPRLVTYKMLATKHKVHTETIRNIIRRRSWKEAIS